MFGDVQPGWAQVQAICDWMHSHITYAKGVHRQPPRLMCIAKDEAFAAISPILPLAFAAH
jgi:hypothetical protein